MFGKPSASCEGTAKALGESRSLSAKLWKRSAWEKIVLVSPRHPVIPPEVWCFRYVFGVQVPNLRRWPWMSRVVGG